jgi:hypothetical protein
MYQCTGDSFSYMKLLLIIKCVQNDRFLVKKIESRLLET